MALLAFSKCYQIWGVHVHKYAADSSLSFHSLHLLSRSLALSLMGGVFSLSIIVQQHSLPSQFIQKTCTWPSSSLIHVRMWEQSCSIEHWDDHQLQTPFLSGWLSLSLSQLHSLPFPPYCTLRIHRTSWCCDMVLVLQVYGSCKKMCACVCVCVVHSSCSAALSILTSIFIQSLMKSLLLMFTIITDTNTGVIVLVC